LATTWEREKTVGPRIEQEALGEIKKNAGWTNDSKKAGLTRIKSRIERGLGGKA